ncbi:hypothetical protein DM558_09820 [Entomomonas moraniae]|uniref:Uncharacterized protein n=1 Tax=Entomomonas moraniae TaxID=2213226 RepID=A0A3S9XF60_9GAMM|nr:hypothetical protein [Entomomonas moraniae]AZS51051.1 hypothetical protein DM558_09820 [Entomomonas moraniae]
MKSFLALLFCCSFIPLAIAENNDCIVPSIKPVSLLPNNTTNGFTLLINKYVFQLKEKPVAASPMPDLSVYYFDKLAGKKALSITEDYESFEENTPQERTYKIFGSTKPSNEELKNIIIGREMLGIECGSANNVSIYKMPSDGDLAFVVNSQKFKGNIFVKVVYPNSKLGNVTEILFENFTQEEVKDFLSSAKDPRKKGG